MSTYLYLVCEDHSPRLFSADEVSQHAHRDIGKVRAWVDAAEVLVDTLGDRGVSDEYFLNHALQFLRQHKTCTIGAEDEYGGLWDLTPGGSDTPTYPEESA